MSSSEITCKPIGLNHIMACLTASQLLPSDLFAILHMNHHCDSMNAQLCESLLIPRSLAT